MKSIEKQLHPTIIHRLIHDTDHVLFKIWTRFINVLIYLSCLAIALDSVEAIKADYQHELLAFEWLSVLFFTLDYAFNIYTAKNKWKYVTSFWGLVDLLSILPSFFMLFNFSSVRAAKILRLLRVIRVLRVLKLARAAMNDVNSARDGKTNRIAANLRIYLIALFSVMMISSTLMFYVEGSLYSPEHVADGQHHLDVASIAKGEPAGTVKFVPSDPISGAVIPEDKRFFTSIPEAMWWCITTLTTTGYGDMYPVTILGRVIAGITMLLGLVLFGMLMNIVGKTLMVMLFGEAVGHEGEEKEKLHTPEDKIRASLDLLFAAGVINPQTRVSLKALSKDDLALRLGNH